MSINVVSFEADTQRQHQRYKLPLKCIIDGYRYSCLDWSVGGVGVATGRTVFPQFETFPIELEFPFGDIVISMKVNAQIRYSDANKGRTGLQYVSPTESNLRFFRYVRDCYLTGDLVAANEVLDFSSRMIDTKARKKDAAPPAQAPAEKVKATVVQSLRIVATAAAGVALLVFLGASLYQKLWTFRAEESLVAIDASAVVAPTDGMLTNIVKSGAVKAGDPVATILPSANGRSVTVFSRCDCVVQEAQADVDTQVRAGQPLLSLSMHDAKPHVVAMVDYGQALRLYKGADVVVDLPQGGRLSDAQIRELPKISGADLASGRKFPVNIDVDGADLNAIVGAPVTVRFVQAPWTGPSPSVDPKRIVISVPAENRSRPGSEG